MKLGMACLCFLLFWSYCKTEGGPQKIDDYSQIEGRWKATAIVTDGAKEDPAVIPFFRWEFKGQVARRTVPRTVTVNGKIRVTGNSRTLTYKIIVGPSKQPKEIDFLLTEKDKKKAIIRAIYILEKDNLKICASKIGGNRPRDFKSTKELETSLMILCRETVKH